MAKFKIILYKSNQKKDGDYPVCLRINKDGKGKYVDLGCPLKGNNGMKNFHVIKEIIFVDRK